MQRRPSPTTTVPPHPRPFPGAAYALAVAITTAVAPRARAHEFWLAPNRYDAARGATIEVRALVATGFRGDPAPYAAPRTQQWVLHTDRTTDLRRAAMNADLVWARFVQPDAGGALLAYEGGFTDIQLAAPDFEKYLHLEGLDATLAARDRTHAEATPGRERYARCAKTWIAGTDGRRALERQKLTLEILPLEVPGAQAALHVRVLLRGKPLPGILLKAFHQPLAANGLPLAPAARDSVGPSFQARADAHGFVTVPVAARGEWLLSAVHMEPSAEPAEADWQSYWASLTFARGAR